MLLLASLVEVLMPGLLHVEVCCSVQLSNSFPLQVVEPPCRANAAAKTSEAHVKRVIVEVCCSEDSLIGQVADKEFQDCKVICITEKDNLNDPSTRKRIVSACKEHHRKGHPILIWTSLPCTGGTSGLKSIS